MAQMKKTLFKWSSAYAILGNVMRDQHVVGVVNCKLRRVWKNIASWRIKGALHRLLQSQQYENTRTYSRKNAQQCRLHK